MPLMKYLLATAAASATVFTLLKWRTERRARIREIENLQKTIDSLTEQARLKAEQEIARQKAIFDSMMEGVAILDSQGRIQSTNLAFRRFLMATEDPAGKTLAEAFPMSAMAELVGRLQRDGMVFGLELSLPGPPVRMLQANANRLSGDQGNLLVLHDQTRLREMERTRRDFVANVSHELRTPISLIKGFVETLQAGAIENPSDARRFLQTIERHTNRLTYLIEDLLTLSRLESGNASMNLKHFPIHSAAAYAVESLESRAAERKVTLENQIEGGMEVMADPERIEQVFSNLVENAIKYGKEGGVVKIGAKRLPAGGVECWVEDDGMGIPEDARHRVFERFYRVDRARARDTGGTGLGLSIVKHIVQAHGGEAWVESVMEKGTTFHFTLPPSD
ncbi:MAG: hypothetical protein FJ405_09865 [Verrucomicrobia bacterium]|nr:hypothetical protein [Verrucomicrobiota bacterium]